jgi:type II secretory pathway predicted ATPase ExeA
MLDVYKSCYRLKDEPFRLSPDHRYSYVHPSYANAKAYLKYGVSQGEGFIVITGEPGTGKTTLINGLLEDLDKTRIQVATLRNVHLDPGNLIKMVADAFNLHLKGNTKTDYLLELEQFLKMQIQRGLRAVLIVDEAQGLSSSSLEELRLLSNLQYHNRLMLQLFLVGQEGVMDMIQAPAMEHLLQRLIAASHLERLELEETVAYIEHRLCHAGWRGDPAISEYALRLIHASSGGVPRRINLICQRLFLYGGLKQKHELVGEDALHVIGELQRERVLSSDPVQGTADDVRTSGPGDNGASALSLPRAESCLQFEHSKQQPIQARGAKSPISWLNRAG